MHIRVIAASLSACTLLCAQAPQTTHAGTPGCPEAGLVVAQTKISETSGGFGGDLDLGDLFGSGVASIGDFDGDGVSDLAVGAQLDDDGGTNRGAIYILFMNTNGTVRDQEKISSTAGGFTGPLDDLDLFGFSVASLGDLDGDGVADIAVGANRDDDGGTDRGAVYILFMNANGTVRAQQKISSLAGGFAGQLLDGDRFGGDVETIGDLDGDGIVDLAVGSYWDDDGGSDRGAVYILLLNRDGTVRSHQKISSTAGGFIGLLDDSDQFGDGVASLGDIDGDSLADLAIGSLRDDDGGEDRGAVYILFLNRNGTVRAHQKISSTTGNFTGPLETNDLFGFSVESMGDLDSDGVTDLAVGAVLDDDGGENRGAVYVLFMNSNGTVKADRKISSLSGGFALSIRWTS